MRLPTTSIIGLCFAIAAASIAQAKPRVSLTIGLERGAPVEAPASWHKLLTDRGADDVQIRSPQMGDKIDIEVVGQAESRSFRVMGVITGQNVLIVPGGKFTLSDGSAIGKWLSELGDNGVEGVTQKKTSFGLTPQQFTAVHDDLSSKISGATKGVAVTEALSQIHRRVKWQFIVDPDTRELLAKEPPIREELEGLSAGTAMAAILRPAGMVLVPTKPSGSELRYLIAAGKDAKEFWPIGWPTDKPPKDLAPILLEFLNVELDDVTAADALNALQGRVKIPFLYDHNGMARQRIDLTQKKIKIPEKKTYYQKAIQHVTQQAGLKHELRVDEAGQPFLWFSPLRGGP